jgi:hypothetical protein
MDTSLVRRQLALMDLARRLPSDRPFTTSYALQCGASYATLRRLVSDGLLAHPIKGVYYSTSLPDSLPLRVSAVKLVTPAHAVVTDRTAGWVWRAERVLAPGAHREVPQVSMFCPPGRRLRNKLVESGQRMLEPRDVAVIDGLRLTTPLRTACDVGRLLHRDQALGVMDSLAALGRFTVPELVAEVERFRGFRGVVQLRQLAPLVDPKSGSPGESTLRLRWIDTGLPRPECQVEVPSPTGGALFIDVGLEGYLLGAEYFGEDFHGEDVADHDEARLAWLRKELGWTIVVARKHNVYGRNQDVDGLLVAAARQVGLLPIG